MSASRLARRKGMAAEQLACEFLETQGLKTIARNFSTVRGEIDLIMADGDMLVFVEVRYRGDNPLVDAAESVHSQKQARIVLASKLYLQTNVLSDNVDCRFDVVAITGNRGRRKIEWIKDAFDA